MIKYLGWIATFSIGWLIGSLISEAIFQYFVERRKRE